MSQKKFEREAALDERLSVAEQQSWLQRNKTPLTLLGLAALGGAGFAGVYFTAATTIPWVVATAAKVGLDLAFLSTATSATTAVASAVVTGIAAGLATAAYATTRALSSFVSWVFSPSKSNSKVEPEEDTTSEDQDELLFNENDVAATTTTNPGFSKLGSPVESSAKDEVTAQKTTEATPVIPTVDTKAANEESDSSLEEKQTSSASNSPR